MDVPQVSQTLGDPVLIADVLREAVAPRPWPRAPARPVEPGGHAVVGELGPIADARPVDV